MKKNTKIILNNKSISISMFYFLVHPFTAVLYWPEYTNTDFSFSLFLKDKFLELFSFKMIRRNTSLTTLGNILQCAIG